MTNMKFKVDSKEQSKQLQEVLFSLGYGWYAGDKTIQLTNMKYLFVRKGKISCTGNEDYFNQDSSVGYHTQNFINQYKKSDIKESNILLKQATKKQAIDFINYELMLRADTRASLLDAVDRIDSIFVNVKLVGDSCSEYYIEPCIAYTNFIYYRPISGHISDALRNPEDFDHVKCIGKSVNGLDVMVAWEDNYPAWKRVYYLGHWNNGNIKKKESDMLTKVLTELTKEYGKSVADMFVKNFDKDSVYDINKMKTISGAISTAFVWSDSPQGHDFWSEIYAKFQEKEDMKLA